MAFLTAVPVQAADGLTGNDRKRYDYFFQEAARLQALGRYGDAFELFEHARKINSRAAEVYFYQSMYYQQMKQDSLAQDCLARAITLAPSNLTFRERMAQYYVANQQYDKAIEAYEGIFAQNHDNTDALYMLLRLYQQQKEYPQMLKTLNRLRQKRARTRSSRLRRCTSTS